jgi:hypothetical protein
MMVTFQARRVALVMLTVLMTALAGCSREQQDWRAAEGADTTEAWAHFIEQHPDSELAGQARAHISEMAEARDWQRATAVASVAAYREFLAQHPHGPRAEDARIRIEAFSLGSAPRIDLPAATVAAASREASGVSALQIANGAAGAPAAPSPVAQRPAPSAAPAQALALPGEAAQAAPSAVETDAASTTVQARAVPAVLATTASAVPLPGEGSAYGVQLGAFGSEASAGREWQRLQGRFGAQLGGLSPRIIETSTLSGQLYRLQVAAAGEAQARAICDSLKEQAQPCVPVLPQVMR